MLDRTIISLPPASPHNAITMTHKNPPFPSLHPSIIPHISVLPPCSRLTPAPPSHHGYHRIENKNNRQQEAPLRKAAAKGRVETEQMPTTLCRKSKK